MKSQSIKGSSSGYVYEIGDTKFLYIKGWYNYSKFKAPLGTGQDNATYELSPMAFEEDGKWAVCNNYRGDHSIGCALNAVSRDKKSRLGEEEFLIKYTGAYQRAMQQEMSNLSQNIRRMDE